MMDKIFGAFRQKKDDDGPVDWDAALARMPAADEGFSAVPISDEEMDEILATPTPSSSPIEEGPLKPESSLDLVEQLEVFKRNVPADIRKVYYPCSATDISPSEAFPDAEVLYADSNKDLVDVLKAAGYNAIEADVTKFKPGELADLVLIENPTVAPEPLLAALKSGGHVLCNDWHGTATALRGNNDLKPIGMVYQDRVTHERVFTSEIGDYWTGISSDAELAEQDEYTREYVTKTVERFLPGRTDLMTAYNEICQAARSKQREYVSERLKQPDAKEVASYLNKSLERWPVEFEYKGRHLSFDLVRRRGGLDSLFIFKKHE